MVSVLLAVPAGLVTVMLELAVLKIKSPSTLTVTGAAEDAR